MALITIVCYLHTLDAPFVFDDRGNLLDLHQRIGSASSWPAVIQALGEAHAARRPVANLTFMVNFWLGGYAPAGWHAVNIALHIGVGWLLWHLVRLTLALPAAGILPHRRQAIAFFTAALWLVHPLQIQSVTYIVQRMNSLAALFYLAALGAYVHFRRSDRRRASVLWLAGAVLAGLLAAASKENAAALPLFVLLYEWFFFQDLDRRWWRRNWPLPTLGVALFAAAALVYLGPRPWEAILAPYADYPFTIGERLLTQTRVVWFYLSLIFLPLPSRLNIDHQVALSRSLTDPWTTLAAVLLLTGTMAAAMAGARRHRLAAFCTLWFFGNLVIESSVFGPELIFEHRTYLPSMAVIGWAVAALFTRPPAARIAPIFAGALLLVLAGWTVERNAVWSHRSTLWQDAVNKSPRSHRAHNNLATALLEQGDLDGAVSHFRTALAISPSYAGAASNLGVALARQGRLEPAAQAFHAALAVVPDLYTPHVYLGGIRARQHRWQEAVAHYRTALAIRPDPLAMVECGRALLQLGKTDAARELFRRAVHQAPRHPAVQRHRALIQPLIDVPPALK